MDTELYRGELVRLAAINPETDAEPFAKWSRDSEFLRLLDADVVLPSSVKRTKEMMEAEPKHNQFDFAIRVLADDRAIGLVGLHGVSWTQGDAWVGIGIGDREYWGKGYGTDAMRLILCYAFAELNLRRVSLTVFEYNPRAIRSYEKVGFVHEGRRVGLLNRDGRRWDEMFMGILREEWEALQRKRGA